MKKKIVNVVLFLAVLAAAVAMTLYVGQGAVSVMVYNFIFLGVMVAIYVVGMFGGMFRMNHLTQSLENAAAELGNLFRKPGRIGTDQVETLNGIFHHPYLDGTMNSFTDGVLKSEEGIDDIEEYLNEEELDNHIHKRLLEMVPDILQAWYTGNLCGTGVGT